MVMADTTGPGIAPSGPLGTRRTVVDAAPVTGAGVVLPGIDQLSERAAKLIGKLMGTSTPPTKRKGR